VQSSFKKNKD
jgi:hypothetical protein